MATENMDNEKEHCSHEAFAAAPGSACDTEKARKAAAKRLALLGQVMRLACAVEVVYDATLGLDLRIHDTDGHEVRLSYPDDALSALRASVRALLKMRERIAGSPPENAKSPNGIELSDGHRPTDSTQTT